MPNLFWANSTDVCHHALMEIISAYGLSDKVVILDDKGKNDYDGFYQRYLHACKTVNTLLDEQ